MPNPVRFQESITKELEIVKDRVRDLVGPANWAEEGRYKESILINAITSQLPKHISIGTGFIIKKENSNNFIISKQHDIIIYDNQKPLIMKYGDFIISPPSNVMGVIEVKSNLSPADFRDAFHKLENSLENLLEDIKLKFRKQNRK